MSEKVISPDLDFVKDVIKSGGESLKKCYQCATCTVVCNVTPDENPFPRKEMIQAQWGLKDELFQNPDIWLCHQCNDCTAYCPRGAKPGEVLGAVRKLSIARYSKPAFLANMVGDAKWLLPLIAFPAVLLLLMLGAAGNIPFTNALATSGGKIIFADFLPLIPYLDGTFMAAAAFAGLVFTMGVLGYWKDLSIGGKPEGNLVGALISTVGDIVSHKKFSQCDEASGRKIAHLLVFGGFVLLLIATNIGLLYEWVLHRPGPYPITDPIKWFGNLGAIALAVGFVLVVINRLSMSEKSGIGSYYDWLFLGVVGAVGATGILAFAFRVGEMATAAYSVYFLHLVSIFFLFAYAPYSKMAHMVYRTTAMVYSNMSGRK
jgi:quinone-modifying oxidoreductase subunit QmoC